MIPSSRNTTKDVRVIERIAQILKRINESETISMKELADACGLAISTTSRLLDSLENVHYVERDPYTKRYRIGNGLLHLAGTNRQRRELLPTLRPALEWLTAETGEDSGLSELRTVHAVIVDEVHGPHPLKIIYLIGTPEPLYCGAFRKVLLAYQDDQWISQYIASIEFQRFTPQTITSIPELWKEIDLIRTQGYATSYGEVLPDGAGVAAPIFDHTGKIRASIQVVFPTSRATQEHVANLIPKVVEAGERGTAMLGGFNSSST